VASPTNQAYPGVFLPEDSLEVSGLFAVSRSFDDFPTTPSFWNGQRDPREVLSQWRLNSQKSEQNDLPGPIFFTKRRIALKKAQRKRALPPAARWPERRAVLGLHGGLEVVLPRLRTIQRDTSEKANNRRVLRKNRVTLLGNHT
jgi:hypothetical protein